MKMAPTKVVALGGEERIEAVLRAQAQKKKIAKRTPKANAPGLKATKHQYKRRGVNAFMCYRTMMTAIFPGRTQAQRSRLVRGMWPFERYKDSWKLMGKVYTFVRDNSEYDNLHQFLSGAMIVLRCVPPDHYARVYNLANVTNANGWPEIRQFQPPTFIRAPRDLTDSQLLNELLMKGLPVEKPVDLMNLFLQQSNFMMTIAKKSPTDLAEAAKADHDFVVDLNNNPVDTIADVMNMPPVDPTFDFGFNIISVQDVTNFDESLIKMTGSQTHYRFEWDHTTQHLNRPNDGFLDMSAVEDHHRIFDMEMPAGWQGYTGQASLREWEAAHGEVQLDSPEAEMHSDFDSMFPAYELQ